MIRDLTARKIASNWHDGQFSPLYAFMSTGAIMSELHVDVSHLWYEIAQNGTKKDQKDLLNLYHYVKGHGTRGPVANWHLLHW